MNARNKTFMKKASFGIVTDAAMILATTVTLRNMGQLQ